MPLVLSGDGAVGPLSATEVSYLDGVTSAVQTQLNGKAATPGAWSDYTPVLTAATTNPTLGTGATQSATYTTIGKVVFYRFKITFGTSPNSGSGTYYVSLPVTAKYTNHGITSTEFSIYDSSANVGYQGGHLDVFSDGTKVALYYGVNAAPVAVSSAAPWTWAANDQIWCGCVYEAA